MRLLVACKDCHKHFDASDRPVGSRFRCSCGSVVTVAQPHSQDAEVVNCSNCGGPREANSKQCTFCSSDFTLHEQDMNTICPECFARVSDKAKFCHHCGDRLLVESLAVEKTKQNCPVCGESQKLSGRQLGKFNASCSECQSCAGLWVGNETVKFITSRVEKNAAQTKTELDTLMIPSQQPAKQLGPMYRKCPDCQELMSRRTFGRASGIVIDICKNHGTWFDADELRQVVEYVQKGGNEKSSRLAQLEEEARLRRHREYTLEDRNDQDPYRSHEMSSVGIAISCMFDLF